MQFFTLQNSYTSETRYLIIVEEAVAHLYDPEFSVGDALEPLATWAITEDVPQTLEPLAQEFSRQDSDPSTDLHVSYRPLALIPQAQ